jgi:hypothetical protein
LKNKFVIEKEKKNAQNLRANSKELEKKKNINKEKK